MSIVLTSLALNISGFDPDGLASVETYYAEEMPHKSATKTKSDNRIDGYIGIEMGRFTSETHQQGHQELYRETA